MSEVTTLRLERVPERTPVKVPISIDPATYAILQEYAELYRQTYGSNEPLAELIPYMLRTFVESDKVFMRLKRARSTSTWRSTEGE